MDLLLWRHAQAEQHALADAALDLARRLTPQGEIQAKRMAAWMQTRLPANITIWCSPAVRCESTVAYLARKYTVKPELAPNCDVQALRKLIDIAAQDSPLLLVGHQPTLGQLIAHLSGGQVDHTSVRKGALWWLKSRQRAGQLQSVTHCVITPDLV